MENKRISDTETRNQIKALRNELAHKIALFVGTEEKVVTGIPRLSLHRRTAPTAPCSIIYEPSIILVPQGRKQVTLGGNNIVYDASRYLLTSIDLPIVARVVEATEDTPCLALMLRLEIPTVKDLLRREDVLQSVPVSNGKSDCPAISNPETTPELLSAFCRLLDLIEHPGDIPFLSSLIEREIIYRILLGPEGTRLKAIATQGDQSQRTAKSIAWIRENYAKPLRMEELADIAGMGVSTLHHHFRELTTLSPLQYQKRLRLQTARELMLVEGLDASSTAFEVGYESPSQFNREYNRLFGQPPMRDVQALRMNGDPLQD